MGQAMEDAEANVPSQNVPNPGQASMGTAIKPPGKFQDSVIDFSEYVQVAEKMNTNPNHFLLRHKTDPSKNIQV